MWAQKASDALDRELDVRYSARLVFAVAGVDDNLKQNELITRTQYKAQIAVNSFEFSLDSRYFEKAGMKEVLLRSIQVQVEPKDITRVRLWPLKIDLPRNPLTQGNESFITIAASMFQPPARHGIGGARCT